MWTVMVRRGAAVLIAAILVTASAPLRSARPPRIWLSPTLLSALRTKAASGDGDWLKLKASADRLLSQPMPRFTVTSATNSNPVRFTLAESLPWTGSTPVFIGGATGRWAAVNTSGDRPVPVPATRVGARSLTIPIDSTAFGRFGGQRLALFFGEGGHSAYGFMGSDWQSALETLGIVYQVTGSEAYAAKGIELIDYIASLGAAGVLAPAATNSGFPSRSAIYGLALGYDWFHDRLTAAERAAIARAVNLWFDWFKRAGLGNAGPAYSNYFGGHVLGFGLAGLATEGENPRGREIADHIRGLFETHVGPAFTDGGFAGGYAVEGFPYGANHFQRLLLYMLAVDTASGAGTVSKSGYPQKIARHLLYALKPNNWQVVDEASCSGDYAGVLHPDLPIVLSALLAGTDEGRWMQHLSRSLAAASHAGQTTDAFLRFLFYDRRRPAADYRETQPTWFHSRGDHHLYRRSSWKPDAVWTSIAGGTTHWASHQMRAAGHIAIQRGNDYLLVNSGQWKGAAGVFGNPQAFDLRSWRGNTLFVDDFGDYLFTGADYLGGQGYWGTSRVLAADGGPEFGYLKTDLTSAYSIDGRKPRSSRSVRHFYRSFLSMGNGVVIVFDRMRFLRADYVKKLYFHLNPAGGPPAISGDTASIRAGSSALFLRTLMPAAPVLAAAADAVSDSDSRPITYRVEVSASTPAAAFDALTVLVATASTVSTMPGTVRLQSANSRMVGAMVADGRVQRIGLFAADGTPQFDVSYTAIHPAGHTSAHVLADLDPGATYRVARDGRSLGAIPASSQGVLTFTSPVGGTFRVRKIPGDRPRVSTRHRRVPV